jgi:hypothetical protein
VHDRPRPGDGLRLEVDTVTTPFGASCVERDIDGLHAAFLEIMPRIETHALIYFRHLKCPGRRADAVQETLAVAWKWFLRITQKGKEVNEFVSTLASYAARHVRSGRGLCGQQPSQDALSPLAQARHGFATQPLPACDISTTENLALEALIDNTITPPPDQAAFRLDFPRWLESLGQRKRELARDLMSGERTGEVAARHGLSQGRVSQIRTELLLDWRRFHGETALA